MYGHPTDWWLNTPALAAAIAKADAVDEETTTGGTKDGPGSGDNDLPYQFGLGMSAAWHYPFTMMEFARLVVIRSKFMNGLIGGDTIERIGPGGGYTAEP